MYFTLWRRQLATARPAESLVSELTHSRKPLLRNDSSVGRGMCALIKVIYRDMAEVGQEVSRTR